MRDFLPFAFFLSFIIFQRIAELLIAKSNEKWMIKQGAIEFGRGHYLVMVAVHILFPVCFCLEKILLNRGLSPFWPAIFGVFIMAQVLRIWIISTLGRCWNTKIIVLPHFSVIRKGPYRFLRHPNYVVVSLELIVIPMLFSAYFTAILFTVVNGLMLAIRIPMEENALKNLTEYGGIFQDCHRFIPKFVKKM
jgi:methyltransferase